MKSRFTRAFTYVDGIIAVVVVCILVALVFPFLASSGNVPSHQTACLSQMKQLSTALIIYASDYDDYMPSQPTRQSKDEERLVEVGWAGKLLPYAKSKGLFRCSETLSERTDPPDGPSTIDFGLNENIIGYKSTTPMPERTVLMFEVSQASALLDNNKDSEICSPKMPVKMSPTGSGINGLLHDSCVPFPAGKDQPLPALYATGRLDNSESGMSLDDMAQPSRHHGHSNYAAIDSHVKSFDPARVSAGLNAHDSGNRQSKGGCFPVGQAEGATLPCAEGTKYEGADEHGLTFSAN